MSTIFSIGLVGDSIHTSFVLLVSAARRHARRERQAPGAALERGEAGLERGAGGVAGPRVLVALVLADRFLRERRGLVDRDRAGPRGRVGVLSRVGWGRLAEGRGG